MNKINSLIALSVATSLIGCGDKPQQPQVIVQAPQQQYQQPYQDPQYAQQQYAQPQYQQPQYQQPVVVQPQVVQHESSSGIGSFVAGAAAGALAGHLMTKDDHNPSPRYNSSSHDYGSTARSALQPSTAPSTFQAPAPALVKKNYMDMSKLSASAKQQIPGVTSAPRPTVSLAKPSAMNMSKLGRK
jgi:hypothetical protein